MPTVAAYQLNISGNFLRVSKGVVRATQKMGRATKKLATKYKKLGKAMGKFAGGLRGLTLAAGGGAVIVGVLKAFGNMESGLTNVNTLMSSKDVSKYSESLKGLSKSAIRLGFGVDDANKGLFDTVSALGTGDKAFAVFETAQDLAIGGVTDLAVSVKGMTAVMNAYGLSIKDVGALGNAFFTAQAKGTTTVGELAVSVGNVAKQGKEAGLTFQELLATMSQITQGGISQRQATTALRGVFRVLNDPSPEAQRVFSAFKTITGRTVAVGATALNKRINVSAANPGGDSAFLQTLLDFRDIGRLNKNVLSLIIPEEEARLAILALQDDAVQRIRETVQLMESDLADPNSGLSKAKREQLETFNRQMAILKGNITLVAQSIGQELAPHAIALAKWVKEWAIQFEATNEKTKKFTATAIVIGVVAGTIAVAMAAIVIAVGWIPIAIGAAFALVTSLAIALRDIEIPEWVKTIASYTPQGLLFRAARFGFQSVFGSEEAPESKEQTFSGIITAQGFPEGTQLKSLSEKFTLELGNTVPSTVPSPGV